MRSGSPGRRCMSIYNKWKEEYDANGWAVKYNPGSGRKKLEMLEHAIGQSLEDKRTKGRKEEKEQFSVAGKRNKRAPLFLSFFLSI